jgi:hypothetical protein
MHAESEKRESRSIPPFSKKAAATILKINEMLPVGHLLTDFHEL